MPVNILLTGNKCLTCRKQLISDMSVNVMTTRCDGGMMRETQGAAKLLRMASSPEQTRRKLLGERDIQTETWKFG